MHPNLCNEIAELASSGRADANHLILSLVALELYRAHNGHAWVFFIRDDGLEMSRSALCAKTRGLPRRVDYPGVPTARGSDNSDIGAFELQAP